MTDSEHITTVAFNGQRVNIRSVYDIDDIRHSVGNELTAFEWIGHNTNNTYLPEVAYQPSEELSATFNPRVDRLTIAGPDDRFSKGRSLLYAAEYLATSIQSSRSDKFLLHSASTYNPDTESSLLILGEKGAGKTTLSVRLCKELGHALIGNDQVYVGSSSDSAMVTFSGNGWFNVRDTALNSDPALRGLIPKTHGDEGKASWNSKQRIEAVDLGISVHDKMAPISTIIHVRIDPTQRDTFAQSWTGVQRNLIIHEKLGRHILGQATPFQDDRGNYIGSLPLVHITESMANRDTLVTKITDKGITELFVPSSDAALEYIEGCEL